MSARVVPFGVGKFRRLLFAGSFSVVVAFLMGFLGTALSGHLLGEEALSGLSLLTPIFSIIIFLSNLLGVGMGVNYALAMGRCDKRRAHELFSQGLWSVLGFGLFSALVLLFGYGAFIAYMNPSPEVARYAADYCRWFFPVAFVEPLSIYLLNCCYADGDERQCYIAYVVQLVVNLGLSYVMLKCGAGTAGCAIGALAGFTLATVVLAMHFFRPSNSFRVVRHFSLRDTFLLMRTSFGDASGYLFESALFFFLGKYFLSHYDSEMLPVLSVVLATFGLLDIFGGVGVAVQPIVSVYVGEGNTKGARTVMRSALKVATFEGLMASLLLVIFPELSVALVGIASPQVHAASCAAVRMMTIGFVCIALTNLLNGFYILIGREILSTFFSCCVWLISPVLSVMALGLFGMSGMWWGMGVGPVLGVVAVMSFLAYRFGVRQCPLLMDAAQEDKIWMYDLILEDHAISEVAGEVFDLLDRHGIDSSRRIRVRLMIEEVLMAVKERNDGRQVRAEVTLDLNRGLLLTLRDDGEIFDITDVDAKVRSLRTYLVCTVMERQKAKMNLITTGFNRNVFSF